MTQKRIELSARALDDIREIGDWVEERAGSGIAVAYVQRIEDFCERLALSPNRGSRRDDIRPGLRIVGFERRIAVAFTISPEQVIIVRVLYGGRRLDSL